MNKRLPPASFFVLSLSGWITLLRWRPERCLAQPPDVSQATAWPPAAAATS